MPFWSNRPRRCLRCRFILGITHKMIVHVLRTRKEVACFSCRATTDQFVQRRDEPDFLLAPRPTCVHFHGPFLFADSVPCIVSTARQPHGHLPRKQNDSTTRDNLVPRSHAVSTCHFRNLKYAVFISVVIARHRAPCTFCCFWWLPPSCRHQPIRSKAM
jgi:hypothetical protein